MDELAQLFSAPFLNPNHRHEYVDIVPSLLSSDQGNTNHVFAASLELDALGEEDFSDATLRLINQTLMEEDDLQNNPCMFQECLALQSTENSFYDALGKEFPPSPSNQIPLAFNFDQSISTGSVNNFVDQSKWFLDGDFNSENTFESIFPPTIPSNGFGGGSVEPHFSPLKVLESSNGSVGEEDEDKPEKSPNRSREKKTRHREDRGDSLDGGRSSKQFASSAQESDDRCEMYDKVLLFPLLNPNLHQDSSLFSAHDCDVKGSNVGGRGHVKKEGNKKEVVDLMNLLYLCAQAVSNADHQIAHDLLNRIRQHSSPYGDGIERLAHYFANALEARLAGTGAALYAAFTTKRISTTDILRGHEVYVKACPFNLLSIGYANRSIGTLVKDSRRLHIIDFGILYGFQWPSLIHDLSMRPGGPPRVQITGIDLPQPGFRPSERVEKTRRRLAAYCERFGVPFQFNAIVKKWDSINLDELKIESDDVLVVNCLYRLRNVPDETFAVNCPRDIVLNLMKRINPEMFIHGVLNGGCDATFFSTRFREAISYSTALFDMFEANLPREDEGRRIHEREVWGNTTMNVIACEDIERVERPETYKQWQVRNVRAGFKQLPLNQEILRELKGIVKLHYNKNFTVEEDGKWMLQGWKGRIMFALSCWKPIKGS